VVSGYCFSMGCGVWLLLFQHGLCGVWLVFQHGLWWLVIVSAWVVVSGYCFSMGCGVGLLLSQHGLWCLVIVVSG
jgi:hypothetical protein